MDKPPNIWVLNGPNLNLLGRREPEVYGRSTLPEIQERCEKVAVELGYGIDFRQTNHEGELVDWIQQVPADACGLVLNAGAYTHTSVAIHDALRAVAVPVVELHLTNVFAREAFRHTSHISSAATGLICGFGPIGYVCAIRVLADLSASKDELNERV